MMIDDFIVLGTAVPEQIKDGRKTICVAGYSPTHGFIRIYPCDHRMELRRWSIYQLDNLVSNPKDTRHESWKFDNSKVNWGKLSEHVQFVGKIDKNERLPLLQSIKDNCVSDINNRHDSLGIVQVTPREAWMASNDQHDKPRTELMFDLDGDKWLQTKADYPIEPRVRYDCNCHYCNGHNQKVLEWGAYEWMRKNPEKTNQYFDNVKLMDGDYTQFFFVGNQAYHRKSFLIINIIPIKTNAKHNTGTRAAKQPPLPLF